MAIDFGMFLSLSVFFFATTCLSCPPLSTRVEKNEEHTMAEELQLEIQSNIYAADWSSLERIAKFFKVECEGKSKLAVAKHVAQQLEEGIGQLKEAEVVPYLEDVKKLLTEKPSSGIKDEGKSGKLVGSDSKPPTVAKEDSVQKLLATSALRRQFKINGQIGELEQKDKISFSSLARQMLRVKLLMVLFVQSHLVWYLEVISKLTKI